MTLRFWGCLLLFAGLGWLLRHSPQVAETNVLAADTPTEEVDRSPHAVAVSPDGRFCLSANNTSETVSLVDWKTGRVLTEHRVGKGPWSVVWIDSERVLVSLQHDDAVALLSFDAKTRSLKTEEIIPIGDEPRAITVHRNNAFIAVSGHDSVAVLDLSTRKVVKRIAVGGLPESVTVSPDGKWLVTCCSVPGEVWVHDASTYQLMSRRQVFDDAFHLGQAVISHDSSVVILPHQVNRTFPLSADNVEKGWAIDNRLTKLPLPNGKYWEQKQMGLDIRGDAAGDANAVALGPDEHWLVVTCGGSHELLIFDFKNATWPVADPGDFVPYEIESREGTLRRVELGGRPVDVKIVDATTAVVANSLANSIQIVDLVAGKLLRTISLGGPKEPSLVRKGEMIFYDADLSLDSWFSCQTCHTDGHTSGQTFDTLNDNNYDTYKLTPSLRGVTKTAPWTWHGWQKSLTASMRRSLSTTLHSQKKVTDEEIEALLAFLGSLKHPASPYRQSNGGLTKSAQRGKQLFEQKADCSSCHSGNYFTSPDTYKVGLESNRYFFPEFNPPSLRGVYSRRRFLHDGRAESLQEVLSRHHRPENLSGEKLNDQ
jgi:YVTN family beta-propeller protein